jgi:hypothetical protein
MVYDNAEVYGDAEVFGDALVYGDAEVFGDAKVSGDAEVFKHEPQLKKGEFYWIKLSRSSEWIPAECTCEVDGCFALGDKGFWTVDEIFEYKHEPIEKP